MKVSDLSKEDLAQLAIAIKAQTKSGRYTELVESIDKRLANIERMLANIIAVLPLPDSASVTQEKP